MFKFTNDYLHSKELNQLGIKCGKNCKIHESVIILNKNKIVLGKNVRIDAFCNLVNKSKIIIKDNVHVSSFVQIYANKNVEIGKNAGLSTGVKIYTSSEVYSLSKETGPFAKKNKTVVKSKKVEIGNYAIVGPNSLILPGAKFLEGAAVGYNSIINSTLDKWTVYSIRNKIIKISKRKKK